MMCLKNIFFLLAFSILFSTSTLAKVEFITDQQNCVKHAVLILPDSNPMRITATQLEKKDVKNNVPQILTSYEVQLLNPDDKLTNKLKAQIYKEYSSTQFACFTINNPDKSLIKSPTMNPNIYEATNSQPFPDCKSKEIELAFKNPRKIITLRIEAGVGLTIKEKDESKGSIKESLIKNFKFTDFDMPKENCEKVTVSTRPAPPMGTTLPDSDNGSNSSGK